MKAILWILGELGINKVPSYSVFKSIQKNIQENMCILMTQHLLPKENIFSFNNLCALIAKVSHHF